MRLRPKAEVAEEARLKKSQSLVTVYGCKKLSRHHMLVDTRSSYFIKGRVARESEAPAAGLSSVQRFGSRTAPPGGFRKGRGGGGGAGAAGPRAPEKPSSRVGSKGSAWTTPTGEGGGGMARQGTPYSTTTTTTTTTYKEICATFTAFTDPCHSGTGSQTAEEVRGSTSNLAHIHNIIYIYILYAYT